MPDSLYDADLRVMMIERQLREQTHRKLDELEQGLTEVQQKVKDARKRLPVRDERGVGGGDPDRGGGERQLDEEGPKTPPRNP